MKQLLVALAATAALTATTQSTAQSADIVVFGDSWSNRLSAPLQQAITNDGNTSITVLNAAFEGERADGLSSSDPAIGLPYITATLAANPDANLVHLSIGGNDLFDGILFINFDAIVNSLLDRIVDDTETIVNHILAQRPGIEVYHSGYDFLQPIPLTSVSRVNEILLRLDTRLTNLAAATPGYTYQGYYGWAQVNFGYPDLGLPPGDPSLPDPNLPSPSFTFVDQIHYTPAVYVPFAQTLYDNFYQSRLDAPCIADVNNDGTLSPADFNAWILAFNTNDPAADQNGDGLITPADFNAWIANFNAGC
jgi:hypothetical protein